MDEAFWLLYFLILCVIGCMLFAVTVFYIGAGVVKFLECCVKGLDIVKEMIRG